MDTSARFVDNIAQERIRSLREVVSKERSGRGGRLLDLVKALLDELESKRSDIQDQLAKTPPGESDVAAILTRQILRLLPQLDGMHSVLATYRGDVGRQDLPVGLLHLVDVLVEELLPRGADPLIHLNSENMYSTLPLVEYLGWLLERVGGTSPSSAPFAEPHPVAFNLPALDPANTLFAPILAHEVGHSACRQSLSASLSSRWDRDAVNEALRDEMSKVPRMTRAQLADWTKTFHGWAEELLCDALGVVLCGPSYLFSLAVFLPAPAGHPVNTHPHERDRVGFALRLLEDLGWTALLRERVPAVFDWAHSLSSSPVLDNSPKETFLRRSMSILEPDLFRVATEHVKEPLEPLEISDALDEALEMLAIEVPPATTSGGRPFTPWELVLAGWVSELHRLGGSPDTLPLASSNANLNRLLVKSIELSGISRLWADA